ncbi:hypothetical protein CP8484711_1807B, partial [Chlamydia psittaci 84-8471/1]
RINQF